jgi:hypothetical protein
MGKLVSDVYIHGTIDLKCEAGTGSSCCMLRGFFFVSNKKGPTNDQTDTKTRMPTFQQATFSAIPR